MCRTKLEKTIIPVASSVDMPSRKTNELMCCLGKDKSLILINEAFCHFFRNECQHMIGQPFTTCIPYAYIDAFYQKINALDKKNSIEYFSHPFYMRNKMSGWLEWVMRGIYNPEGEILEYQMFGQDISEKIALEIELKRTKENVEREIKERTSMLESRLKDLTDLNTTLKVLLEKMHKEKMQIKEEVKTKVKELVIPYVKRLKESPSEKEYHTYLNIIETNLDDIISPYVTTLSRRYRKLSPSEVKVVLLVRQGKTAKEIAELLNVSSRTIESYRCRIRRKMGLLDRRVKLKAYLDSLEE